jgi:protein ImuA
MNILTTDSARKIASLKRLTAKTERRWHKRDASALSPLGHGAIDAMLGGGLASARLHEIFAGSVEDAASAAGFTAMLAQQRKGAVIWIKPERTGQPSRHFFGEGLSEIGLDPARLLLCTVPDAAGVLKAANEAARSSCVATVIAELWHRVPQLSLVASRRLALSVETSGAALLLLRIGAEPEPSAATTRWLVSAAPSDPLATNAPGHVTLELTLLRQRGRAGEGSWRVVWDRDYGCFTDPLAGAAALSGAVRPASAMRLSGLAEERNAA